MKTATDYPLLSVKRSHTGDCLAIRNCERDEQRAWILFSEEGEFTESVDHDTVADWSDLTKDVAEALLTKGSADALVAKLEQVNRNILDEAGRIGDAGRSVLGSSYDTLLGEAAGVRMALRFVREAVGYLT